MSDLKPCPFCGSNNYSVDSYDRHHRWYAWCNDCHALLVGRDTKEEAIEAWNERVEKDEVNQ